MEKYQQTFIKGTFTWIDDKSYTGEWKDNSLHGFGVYNKIGKIYIGYFKNDKKNGLGKYFYKGNKERFLIGEFTENALYGLTLHFYKNKLEDMVIMEKNKVQKTLKDHEKEEAKIKDEYIKLINFHEKLNKLNCQC